MLYVPPGIQGRRMAAPWEGTSPEAHHHGARPPDTNYRSSEWRSPSVPPSPSAASRPPYPASHLHLSPFPPSLSLPEPSNPPSFPQTPTHAMRSHSHSLNPSFPPYHNFLAHYTLGAPLTPDDSHYMAMGRSSSSSLSWPAAPLPSGNSRTAFFLDPIQEAYLEAEREAPPCAPDFPDDPGRSRVVPQRGWRRAAPEGRLDDGDAPPILSMPQRAVRSRTVIDPPAASRALQKSRSQDLEPVRLRSSARPSAAKPTATSFARSKQIPSSTKQQHVHIAPVAKHPSKPPGEHAVGLAPSPTVAPMSSVFAARKPIAPPMPPRRQSRLDPTPHPEVQAELKEELTQIRARGFRTLAQYLHHKLKQPAGAREDLSTLDLTHTSDMPFLRAFGDICQAEGGPSKVYQTLFEYVHSSAGNPAQGKCAANAISMLNAARVSFSGMDLRNINIPRAILRSADFSYASLSGANLEGSDLKGAILDQADFAGANLTDVTASELLKTLEGDGGDVRCVAVSQNGKVVTSASADGTMRIWDEGTGSLQHRVKHPGNVTGLGMTADGRRIVSGATDAVVRLWNTATGILTTELKGHTGEVTSVAIAASGSFLASGSVDGTVRVWNADGLLHTLEVHVGPVRSVAMSATGGFVASGGEDGKVLIWDAFAGQVLRTLSSHKGPLKSLALSGDGAVLVSSGMDNMIRIWNSMAGEETKAIEVLDGDGDHVAISEDGRCFVSTAQCAAQMWQANGIPLHTFEGHSGVVRGLAVSGNGSIVVSCSADGTVRVWNGDTGQALKSSEGYHGEILCVRASGDGNFVVSGSADRTVRVWGRQAAKLLEVMDGHTGLVWTVAASADCSTIVSGSDDRTVRIWDYPAGTCRTVMSGHSRRIFSVDVTADGRIAISGSEDQSVKLWDTVAGVVLRSLYAHSRWVVSVAISADGTTAVSGSDDQKICVWDQPAGQLLNTLRGHAMSVIALAISADGGIIVSGSKDGTARIWSRETGETMHVLEGHEKEVYSVAVSDDGALVATGCGDAIVRLWDGTTGAMTDTLEGHIGEVSSVSMPHNGAFVVSGSADRTLRIWKLAKGKWRSTVMRGSSDALILFAHKMRLSPSTSLAPSLKEVLLTSGAIEV